MRPNAVTQTLLVLGSNCKGRGGYSNKSALKFYTCSFVANSAMGGNAERKIQTTWQGVEPGTARSAAVWPARAWCLCREWNINKISVAPQSDIPALIIIYIVSLDYAAYELNLRSPCFIPFVLYRVVNGKLSVRNLHRDFANAARR